MKKGISLLLAVVLAFCFAAAGQAREFEQPQLTLPCRAAVLIHQDTGTVLYQMNADTPMPIASITKVMTLLLTMEALDEGRVALDDMVPVSEHSYQMGGSQIWLEPGEEVTLDEMLKAICVSSANDAAVAVAEFIGGSEEVFVEQMNQKAAQLGMTNTHFENACGLDEPGHLSTAMDVAIMSREILTNHPQITNYTTIWMDSLRDGQTQLLNTNKLLKSYNGITGLKTGTTGGAGVCVTASASRDGLNLIAVVLGSSTGDDRWTAARTLLDYGFANFQSLEVERPQEAPAQIPVEGGDRETLELSYSTGQRLLIKKGEGESLEITPQLPESISAPIEKGQEVGQLKVSIQGQEMDSIPITAAHEVKKLDLFMALERLWQAFLTP